MRSYAWPILAIVQSLACSGSSSTPAADGVNDKGPGAMPAAMLDSGAPRSGGSTREAGSTKTASGGSRAPSQSVDAGKAASGASDSGAPSQPDSSSSSGGMDSATGGGPIDAGAPPENCVGTKPLDVYTADPKLCVYVFAEDMGAARQLAFAPNGDLFVNNGGQVSVLWDEDADGYSSASERSVFGSASRLNHGVVFSRDAKFLYASSDVSVYRWAYTEGAREASGSAQVVISGIPGGGHNSRTLAFDSAGRLYVSVGSAGNLDSNPDDIRLRSQIRRYQLPESLPQGGLAYDSGEVIATGMRNEAGIYIDDQDRLWGVENGRDELQDSALGGDIHNDNPGEEINLVDGKGSKFYGYPSCFSEHTLAAGKGAGTQWADTSVADSLLKNNAICTDPNEVHPPAYTMPAHWAPLGIIQYTGRSLPYTGDLIVGSHGSWNRSPANGRVIARAKLQGDQVTDLEILVGQKNNQGELVQGRWDVRPVDVRQGPDEAIYVSDDSGRRILKIGYRR